MIPPAPTQTLATADRNLFRAALCFLAGLLTVCALASPAMLPAATYYIDPTGNDANAGTTTATAWKTLAKVNSVTFAPGDHLLFKAGGVWNGQLWPKGSGTSASPIVIDLYGTGAKPIINGNGTTYPVFTSGAVMLYNVQYWEINNLEVTNTSATVSARAGIYVYGVNVGTLNHIHILNCYVHDVNSNKDGAKMTGGIIINTDTIDKDGATTNGGVINAQFNDVLVQGCDVFNVAIEGIRNSSATESKINSNIVFRDNYIDTVWGDGMVLTRINGGGLAEYNVIYRAPTNTNGLNYAGLWTYASAGTKIQFNEVALITSTCSDAEAFDADINTNGDIFQYNYSHDNKGGFMLIMPSAQNTIVRYNISQNDGNGTEIFHYTANTYSTNQIYNNTFYVGPGISTVLFRSSSSAAIFNFKNNIVHVAGTLTSFATNPVSSGSTFKNNVFFPASITSVNGPAGTVSGNINSDPVFIAAGTGGTGMPIGTNGFATGQTGYKLQPGSPALNSGILVSNNGGFDYWGNAVSATVAPNIGAYNGPGVAGFTLSASPSSQTVASPGGSTSYTVTVTPQTGFTGTVGFTVSGLPTGTTGTFNPASVNGSGISTLSVITSANTPLGTSTLTITGTSGSLVSSTTVQLTVGSTVTLTPTADSYVRDGTYATTNFGSAVTMMVKADAAGYFRKAYTKFDMTTAPSVSLATLKLYVANVNTDASRTISVYAVSATGWGESTITWNNAPVGATLLGSFNVTNSTGVWYNFDVTSYLQSQKAGGINIVSILLINNGAFGSRNDVTFATKEAATGKPQLVITP